MWFFQSQLFALLAIFFTVAAIAIAIAAIILTKYSKNVDVWIDNIDAKMTDRVNKGTYVPPPMGNTGNVAVVLAVVFSLLLLFVAPPFAIIPAVLALRWAFRVRKEYRYEAPRLGEGKTNNSQTGLDS